MKKFFAIVLGLVMALSLTTVASAAVVEFEGGFLIEGTYTTDWTWKFDENPDAGNNILDIKFSQGFLDVATASLTLGLIVDPDANDDMTLDDPVLDLEMKGADYTYIFSDSFSLAAVYAKDGIEAYKSPIFEYTILTSDTQLKAVATFEGGSFTGYTNLTPASLDYTAAVSYSAGALTLGVAAGNAESGDMEIGANVVYALNDAITVTGDVFSAAAVSTAVKVAYAGDPLSADATVKVEGNTDLEANVGFQASESLLLEAGVKYDVTLSDLYEYSVKGTVTASDTLSVYAEYNTGNTTIGADLLLDGTNTLKTKYETSSSTLTVSLAIDF